MSAFLYCLAPRARYVALILLLSLGCTRFYPPHKERADTSPPPVYDTPDLTPRWASAAELASEPPRAFPEFALQDQAGHPFTRRDLEQHIVVASFFYSRCSELCPRLRSAMAQVRAAFPGDPRLLLVSHSVTPASDPVPALAAYAKENGIDANGWRLLTGPAETIQRLERQGYLVPRPRSDQGPALHSEMLVLLDRRQRVRGVYNGTLRTEIQFLERDIGLLEAESP